MKQFILLLLACTSILPVSAQKIQADQTTIDLGQVIFRQPATATFQLQNKSNHKLIIQQVRISCGCTAVNYQTTPIPAGETFQIQATYDAATMGHFNKQIALFTSAAKKPTILNLRGIVVDKVIDYSGDYPYTLGTIRADKNNIEFDNVNLGEQPIQKIYIINTSDKTLQPVLMHLPAYLTAQISPSTLQPGKQGTATITLHSSQLHDFGLTQSTIYLGEKPGDHVSQAKSITVNAILLPAVNTQPTAPGAQPAIQLSDNKIILTPVGKKKLKGEITIHNNGAETLEIQRLQLFTTGIQLSLTNKEILPGKTEKLRITANINDFNKLQNTPRLLIITNDPNNLKLTLNIESSPHSTLNS